MQRDLAELVQVRGRLKGSISRTLAYAEKPPADCTVEDVSSRLERLGELWEEFTTITTTMYKFKREADYTDPNADFEIYEDKVMSARGRLRTLRNALQPPPTEEQTISLSKLVEQQECFLQQFTTAPKHAAATKENDLPKIIISPFTGQYKAWPSFKDLFVSAVHEKSNLTNTQKFHYLKSFLKDEAAQMLMHIPVTDKSYATAWARLNERYDRPRHIVASFIETFVSLPSTISGDVTTLRRISDGANEVIRGLEAIGRGERDCWLIHWLETKLDTESRRKWIEASKEVSVPTITEFFKFLDSRCEELELAHPKPTSVGKFSSPSSSKFRNSTARAFVSIDDCNTNQKCIKCGSTNHTVSKCPIFASLSVQDRRLLVKDRSLCFNCLRVGHTASTCVSKFRCRHCNRSHHTTLHSQSSEVNPQVPSPLPTSSPSVSVAPVAPAVAAKPWSTAAHVSQPSPSSIIPQNRLDPVPMAENHRQALLPTALVSVQTAHGHFIPCRMLIDSASELSYISERCAQKLGIPRAPSRIVVTGIASSKAETTCGCITLFIKSRVSEHNLKVAAHVLSNITTKLPATTININSLMDLQGIQLADPTFNISSKVDILLGSQHVWDIFTFNKMVDNVGNQFAISTVFGWVITSISSLREMSSTSSHITVADVDHTLRKFWEIEESKPLLSTDADDLLVEQHFMNTVSRQTDGKYSVDLPFKGKPPHFANTLQGAISRFYAVERRLLKNTQLRDQYIHFMRQYELLGHMCAIKEGLDIAKDGRVFYLPHHPVLGKKLRVVFDGSYADTMGVSLNSVLHAGPNIQRNLFSVCLRFRFQRFVFTADIVKMFRQIWIAEYYRDFQRIVWRESPDLPLKHYRLNTVTYGTACAPFLAVRVLQQLACDYKEQFPRASSILLEDFYMDDVLTGAASEIELIERRDELIRLLRAAGMELSKWVSNSTQITSDQTAQHEMFSEATTRVLGLYWSPKTDILTYQVRGSTTSVATKRHVLSAASRLFDPLGLLSPIVIRFKVMFQELWLQNLDWDDPLPTHLDKQWSAYQEDIRQVRNLTIARFVSSSATDLELHAFSDASLKAYAAVVYCRSITETGQSNVSLIAAKTRVAPLKTVSLPRLELCGALLLTRLVKVILDSMTHRTIKVLAWCDSTIVMSWLSIPPVKLKTFVGNRTSEILDTLPRNVWHHVTSKDNPADCASRGMSAAALANFDLWWKGPSWLSSEEKLNNILNNKIHFTSNKDPDITNEVKGGAVAILATAESEGNILNTLIERISSWQRLLRTLSYVHRFIDRLCKRTSHTTSINLTFDEIDKARNILLRHTQGCFKDDIEALKHNRHISNRSKIIKLSPFLDENDLLRVGGRISNSSLDMEVKHPIILPKRHKITDFILTYEHHRHLHPGVSALFVIVRQQYWILGARNLIRKITHACLKCFRQRRSNTQQLMADLPKIRVQRAFPFQHTGCDYAGPITMKLYRGRNARQSKGYICLFVCLATSAIHIELVTDLSTDGFLSALRRFISRRGKCTQLFSDNGRNFLGASRVLNEMHQTLLSQVHNETIAEILAGEGIRWNYIPPYAPHWGGIWESAVRSVKLHMRRVIGSTILTTEQLTTLLTQIEAVVNSRPLGVTSDTDTNYLSPSHFLIGRPLTMVPEGSLQEISENKLDYWQHIQNMYQGFWRRWHREYLTSLQNRPKWNRRTPNIAIGDIVLVKEPNTPPAVWPLGNVVEIYPGADGLVRTVKLRTARGEMTRPITKLTVLPLF